MKATTILLLGLAAVLALGALTTGVRATETEVELDAELAREIDLEAQIQEWMALNHEDDVHAHALIEAESDADAETEAETEGEADRFGKMLSKARAAVSASPAGGRLAAATKAAAVARAQAIQARPAVTARQAQARAQPRAANGRFIPKAAAKPAPPAKGGLFARLKAGAAGLANKVTAGAKVLGAKVAAGASKVNAKLQKALANPKLAKLGQKLGAKLKEVSTKIKAKLKDALKKAKTPADKKKAILAAKKAAKNAKKAAVKVATKAAKKQEKKDKKGKKASKKSKKDKKSKKGSKKDKKSKKGKKLTKAERKARRAAKKAARKARRAARKGKKPRSSSTAPRDAEGRFVGRYKLPKHTAGAKKGQQKSKKEMSKAERKAYKTHKSKAKQAKKTLKDAKKKRKIAKADLKFAQAKAKKLRKAAKGVAQKAAAAVRSTHTARQAAAMGGPKAKAELAAAEVAASKLQKEAVAAQSEFRAQKSKVKGLRAAYKATRKAVRDAEAAIHENGFDLLLDKVGKDLKKLDKALFGGKKDAKKGKKGSKKSKKSKGGKYRTVRRQVDVPDPKHPGTFIRKDMQIVERVPTKKWRVMVEKDIPDPKRPGFTVRKLVKAWRKVKKAPKATRPVTIVTKKEKRPYKLPDGKTIPVEVTYQVATQTVRAKSSGKTPAGFRQQEVTPPAESGLVYREVTREFPVLIGSSIRNLPFTVSTWSKTRIVLEEKKGRSVATLHVKEVEAGASPISIKQVQSAPRMLDGKLQLAILKLVPVKTKRGIELKNAAVDVPVTGDVVKGKAPKLKVLQKKRATPKNKLKVVYEGVDNSIAQQNARKAALKAVEEDIEDNAKFGSISERHIKAGHLAHTEVDRVRENFYDHQEELVFKQLIRPEHRFLD